MSASPCATNFTPRWKSCAETGQAESRSFTIGPTAPKSICPVARLERGHDTAHVADAGGAGFGDGGDDGCIRFRLGQLAGQEFLDHLDLGQFLFGQFQPPAFFIGARTFLTLLHHLAQDRRISASATVPSPPSVRLAISRSLMAALISRRVDRRSASLARMASFRAA
jgi:hypothetical protein